MSIPNLSRTATAEFIKEKISLPPDPGTDSTRLHSTSQNGGGTPGKFQLRMTDVLFCTTMETFARLVQWDTTEVSSIQI
jgi:hypothetical protein